MDLQQAVASANVGAQTVQTVVQPQVGVAPVQTVPNTLPQVQTVAQPSQALFTQEQLNSIISGRINPLNQKISELTAQLAQAQQLSQSYLGELTAFKQRDIARKSGVPDQFVDFAVFEANKLAVNGKSFDDAIKEYVASNQQLLVGVSQTAVQPSNPTQVVQGTQVVANPAQNGQIQQPTPQTQQPQQPIPYVQQLQQSGQMQPSGQQAPSVVPQTVTIGQPNVQQVVQPVVQQSAVQGVQVGAQPIAGATGYQGVGQPQGVNTIATDVQAFLKEKGVAK